jgi:hypothetical protein
MMCQSPVSDPGGVKKCGDTFECGTRVYGEGFTQCEHVQEALKPGQAEEQIVDFPGGVPVPDLKDSADFCMRRLRPPLGTTAPRKS